MEIETIRDAVHDHGSEHDPLWTGQWNDVMGPDRGLEELIPKEKEPTSLVVEEMVERDEPPTATSAEAQELITNPQISFGGCKGLIIKLKLYKLRIYSNVNSSFSWIFRVPVTRFSTSINTPS